MDSHNLFETPTTYRALRAEYGVALAVALALFVINVEDVRWAVAAGFFLYTDLIGYIPGAIAYRRSRDGSISRAYYVLYNVMHSIVTAAAVAGLWALLVEPEWALLASAIHIAGDRAVFGNFMKPFSVHFEPREHPAYARVKPLLERPAGAEPEPGAGADGVGRAGEPAIGAGR